MKTNVALFENQTTDGSSAEISWAGGTPAFFVAGTLDGGTIQIIGAVAGNTENIGDAITETGFHVLDAPVPVKTEINCDVSGAGASADITVILMSV